MVSLNNPYKDSQLGYQSYPPFEQLDGKFDVWGAEEKVINGDVSVIPSCSVITSMEIDFNSPPPELEDFYKMNSDWHNLMNMELLEMANTSILEQEEKLSNMIPNLISEDIKLPTSPSTKFSGKKIDMNAKCYLTHNNERVSLSTDNVYSDEDSDTENSNKKDIEIIKTEIKEEGIDSIYESTESKSVEVLVTIKKEEDSESDFVDVDGFSNDDLVLLAGDVNSLLEKFEASVQFPQENKSFELPNEILEPSIHNQPDKQEDDIQVNNKHNKNDLKAEFDIKPTTSKQIRDSLPLELIRKIQNNKSRKVPPIIDPIPAKRRNVGKNQSEVIAAPAIQPKLEVDTFQLVKLDHNYCSQSEQNRNKEYIKGGAMLSYPTLLRKDSGFQFAEEDSASLQMSIPVINERSLLKSNIYRMQNQSTLILKSSLNEVKPVTCAPLTGICTSTTYVSTTTNQNNSTAKDSNVKRKRKLNLAEYKKRRDISKYSYQSQSPSNSCSNSPRANLKENPKQYQQKLTEMAAEVLKAIPKAAVQNAPQTETLTIFPKSVPELPTMPSHLERKVLISIGVNTVGPKLNWRRLNIPLKELDDIRPILENASDKINDHSLIASVIENVNNKKIKDTLKNKPKDATSQEHGEDKIIMYPEKNRPKKPTKDASTQTEEIHEKECTKYKRKRSSSRSSCEDRGRSTSRESRYSFSSPCSSYSNSSSELSHSPRPRCRRRNSYTSREREVFERRILYIGGISSYMTKEALRKRFQQFGQITKVSVHFPEHGDNYGFVTFVSNKEACRAIDHGNDDPSLPWYDLHFGGRRIFCRTQYSDLDKVDDDIAYPSAQTDSFDNLLEEMKAKLCKRKSYT